MLTVLVIDDDPDLLEMVGAAFTASGMRVMSLDSEKEAITVARQGSPDVILLDIILGDSDGRTLCRR
ncbi:MAG TPA: response regulator, partial [Chitinophagaceae bacterium]